MDKDKIKRALNAIGVQVQAVDNDNDNDKIYIIIKNCCVCGNELIGRFTLHKVIKLHGNNKPVCDICTRRLSRLAHMTYRAYRRGDKLD